MPNVKCILSVLYDNEHCAETLIKKLSGLGFENLKIHKPKCENTFSVDLTSSTNEKVWDIDEAISESFSMIANNLDELKEIVSETRGKFFVDVVIEKYDTYPAMVFSGKNMKIIHFLEADISLDCYDLSSN